MDPLIITSAILLLAVVLFLSNRLRPDLVALFAMLALGLSGVLTPQETFSGFSTSAVIAILAIFILAEGLRQTGLTDRLGQALVQIGGKREGSLVLTVTLAGALLSLFMNNIAAASVLMPAITGAARKTGISASRLLMPLAFGTILGGMATLLTTTNILVSGILRQQGLSGFGLLDFLPVGIPVVVFGTLYITLIGRRLLPRRIQPEFSPAPDGEDTLQELYRLEERLIRARVFAASPLNGRSVQACGLRERFKLNILAVQRAGRMIEAVTPAMQLKEGDILHLIGRLDLIPLPELQQEVELLDESGLPGMALTEVVLTPRSRLLGQTLRAARFHDRYGVNVLAIWRGGRPYRTGHADMPLQFGDALLLQGSAERISILQSEPELLVLSAQPKPVNRPKAALAMLIMLTALVVGALDLFPLGEVLLAGAFLMVLLRVLDMDQAYRAVEWKSVFLVAGMLPLGTALVKTGAAGSLGGFLVQVLDRGSPLLVLAVLVGVTMLLTQVMNGAAVAAILAPIAIQIGLTLGLDPRALAMGVTLASSVAFITPLGHPVNILVMGPGGYRFRDYARVGLLLTLVVLAVILVFLPLSMPPG